MSNDLRSTLMSLATEARPAGDATAAISESRHQTQRRALIVVPIVVVMALLLVSLAVVLQGAKPVLPASGPGSLPDRIYPTKGRMLTLGQAPIGRVGMLYGQPIVNGVSAWVVIGATSDEYRWVAPFQSPDDPIAVSPDGRFVAVGLNTLTAATCAVEVTDATSGQIRTVAAVPGQMGLGCSVDSLMWSPDGASLAVAGSVVRSRDGSGWSGRSVWYLVDAPTLDVTVLPVKVPGDLIGWTPEGLPALGHVARRAVDPTVVVSSVGPEGERDLASLRGVPVGFTGLSLSPDGRLLAGLKNPDPSASGTGAIFDLEVYSLVTQKWVLDVNLASYIGDSARIVGWRDASTPVLSVVRPGTGRSRGGNWGQGQVVAYPIGGPTAGEVVLRAGSGDPSAFYSSSRIAQDVLRDGTVRVAVPPQQAWYDPRLLGPTVWADVRLPLFGLGLIGVFVLVVWLAERRRRRRRARRRSDNASAYSVAPPADN